MPGETIYIVGQLQWEGTGKCGAGAKKIAFFTVYYDTPNVELNQPTAPGHELAEAVIFDETGTAPASGLAPVDSYDEGAIPPPASPTARTLTMFFSGLCNPGPGSISASEVKLNVIGVK
jgi:hypothetical protein